MQHAKEAYTMCPKKLKKKRKRNGNTCFRTPKTWKAMKLPSPFCSASTDPTVAFTRDLFPKEGDAGIEWEKVNWEGKQEATGGTIDEEQGEGRKTIAVYSATLEDETLAIGATTIRIEGEATRKWYRILGEK